MNRTPTSPLLFIGIIGIILIALFITSAASGITVDKPASNHFINKSNYGFYGFYELLKGLNKETKVDGEDYGNTDGKSVIIYVDSSTSDSFLTESAINWVSEGNNLIIQAATANIVFDCDILEYGDTHTISFIPDSIEDIKSLKSEQYLNTDIYEYFDEVDIIAETSNGPFIIEGSIGIGSVIIITSFDFYNNLIFKDNILEKGYILDYIISPHKDKKIYLREKLGTLTSNPSFIRDFFTGNYSYLTFQVVILFILLTIYTGKRFVRPQKLSVKKQKKITEHINAVANLYKRADAKDLIRSIDISFFKTVVCKNRIPFNINESEYNRAVNDNGFKNGFLIRDTLLKKIIERRIDD